MQVTETLAEGLKHEFKVSVPASDIDAKVDARLVDMKDKVKLNGFRPGKVPVAHLKKVYGRSVAAETVEQLIRDTNAGIFTERGFRLATEPKVTMPTEEKEIEAILEGKSDLNYSVAIEVVPAIELADFKSFNVEAGGGRHRRGRRRSLEADRRPEPSVEAKAEGAKAKGDACRGV